MKPRILLAEDESIFRMDIKEMLEEDGYEVVGEAGDGEEAVKFVYELNPDLIIMDIKMPKMNGLKASKIISRSHQTPILLLTAYSQKDFINDAKQSNVLGYLVKPISDVDLIPAVEIVLSQAAHINQYKTKVGSLKQKLNNRKLIERAKGALAEKENITENEAYKKMRKYSMDHQQSMEKIAYSIIKKYSNQKI